MGDVIGRYQIIQKIGQGAMGQVYKAYDPLLDRMVALKVLSQEKSPKEQLERFFREAQAAARLHHPNIAEVYDIGAGPPSYFAMELIEGPTLSQALKKASLTLRQAVSNMVKICRAMDYAHKQGVIHRDLKPANILLDSNGEPKIVDFGLSKIKKVSKKISLSGAIIGTLEYMPPEQAAGRLKDTDEKSDVYGLGAVFYEMLTGRPPFGGGSLSSYQTICQIIEDDPIPPGRIKPKVPKALESICLKAMEKNKSRRYPTAEAFAEDLQRFQAGESVKAHPIGILSRSIRKIKKHRAVLAALCAIVCIGMFFLFHEPSSRVQVRIMEPRELDSAEGAQDLKSNERVFRLKGRISGDTLDILVLLNGSKVPWEPKDGSFLSEISLKEGQNGMELLVFAGGKRVCQKRWRVSLSITDVRSQMPPSLLAVLSPMLLEFGREKILDMACPEWENLTHEEKTRYAPAYQEAYAKYCNASVEKKFVISGAAIQMRFIPPGRFWMGCPDKYEWASPNQKPRHKVIISRPFWMGTYEVTQGQWNKLMTPAPVLTSWGMGDDFPACKMSWEECQEFCKRLSFRLQGTSFRLPTEAQWEYACRAGTTTPYYWGESVDLLKMNSACSWAKRLLWNDQEWKETIEKDGWARLNARSMPVGSYPPNPFGLYDMAGNILEMCQDSIETYSDRERIDPFGKEQEEMRMTRGGSWYDSSKWCCSSNRNWRSRRDSFGLMGLRIVLPFEPEKK